MRASAAEAIRDHNDFSQSMLSDPEARTYWYNWNLMHVEKDER